MRRTRTAAAALVGGLSWASNAPASDSDVRLSSVGYLPDRAKVASIAVEADAFTVRRWEDDGVVYEGGLSEPVNDWATGDVLRLADFTELSDPGIYVLEVSGVGRSVPFPIADDAYDEPFVSAMLGFYGWRCGTDVSLTHRGTIFAHAACHLEDAYLDYLGQAGEQRDGTGGWHDAGDYGKYVVNSGAALGPMLAAFEQFPEALSQIELPIPETGGDLPDYLDEIRWNLEWLLKMQYSETDGRVSHKLTAQFFADFILPADDHARRYFVPYGTAATADFVAVLAKAARIYEPYDPDFASRCLGAAQVSYAYLVEHPEDVRADVSGLGGPGRIQTGDYQSDDPDDRLWAAAEIWETTGDSDALADFEARARGSGTRVVVREVYDWPLLDNLGLFTYALSEREGRDPELVSEVRDALFGAADALVSNASESGYGRAVRNWDWGSNGIVARTCTVLLTAYQLEPNSDYLEVCAAQLGHLFGRNTYNRSQVTGVGKDPPCFPHHRPSGADDELRPYPGLLVGGGTDPTNWVDNQGSYTTNEVAINWNGALVYALAPFLAGTGADVTEAEPWMDDGYLCELPPNVREVLNTDTSGPPSLIDDLEDGDLRIREVAGRQGEWFDFDDGTGTQTGVQVAEPGLGDTGNAARVTGSGFTVWGGGIGLSLNDDGVERQAYDASNYNGVSFWARTTEGPGSYRFLVADANTAVEGGVCSSCYDHFQTPFTVTEEWQRFVFTWGSLQQLGFGDLQPQVDRSALYALQFQFGAQQTFDLWIDDVAFATPAGAVEDEGMAGAAGHWSDGLAVRHLQPRGGCACALGQAERGRSNILLVTALAALAVLRRRLRRWGSVGGRWPNPARSGPHRTY